MTTNLLIGSRFSNHIIRLTGNSVPLYTGKRGEAFRLIKDGDTVGNWGGKVAHMEKVDLSFLRFYEREGLIKLLG